MKTKHHGFRPISPILAIAVWITGLSIQARAETMTLEDAIACALRNDPTIQKIHADVLKAEGFTTEVRSERRPQLRASADSGYGYRSRSIDGLGRGGEDLFDRRGALILEQLVWDNGHTRNKWMDAKCREKAAELLSKAQRETTAMGTVDAYLSVLKARKQIELARQNVSSHRRFFKLASDREGGAGSGADVELSSSRLRLAEVHLKERELDLRQAEADFERYLCCKPPSLVFPKVPSISCETAINPTENFHYLATLHQCKAAKLAAEAAAKAHSPRILFRGTGSYGQDVLGIEGEDEEASALMVMEWDLLQGGRRKGIQQQAVGDIAKQVAIVDETKTLLCRDIKARWADYQTLNERIHILEDYSRSLGSTVSLYQEQFELDKRPLLGVLDIENEKLSSQIRLVDERFERAFVAYRLLFFGGKLICSTAGTSHLCDTGCINLDCPEAECVSCEDECQTNQCAKSSFAREIRASVVETADVPKKKNILNLFSKKKKSVTVIQAMPVLAEE
ncbi:MAG: TolC family protein [Verrucomicrobiales bacterium]|nr:TolC family protein [Verrucomicrobiales bacterium]